MCPVFNKLGKCGNSSNENEHHQATTASPTLESREATTVLYLATSSFHQRRQFCTSPHVAARMGLWRTAAGNAQDWGRSTMRPKVATLPQMTQSDKPGREAERCGAATALQPSSKALSKNACGTAVIARFATKIRQAL